MFLRLKKEGLICCLNIIYSRQSKKKNLCRTHPEELGLQQTLQHLVAAFPLSLLLQDALQEDPDLSDLGVCWEQIDGLEEVKPLVRLTLTRHYLLINIKAFSLRARTLQTR